MQVNSRPWENPVVKWNDLESGHNEIISVVFIFDVLDDDLQSIHIHVFMWIKHNKIFLNENE